MKTIVGFLHELGGIALFIRDVFRTGLTTSGNLRPIVEQVAYVSLRSFSTVAFGGIFVGAILVLQFYSMLREYDAQILLGGLNTSSVIRQIGPLIISFLLAGRIGAFTAAELGTMRVTEQVDAIRCLGTHPIQYLILPRFVAIVISSAMLLFIGLAISVAGSLQVASLFCGINPLQYLSSIPKFVTFGSIASGLFKALTFGFVVASVACYRGYTATGGARGVGQAVTRAAIYTNLYIVIADLITSQIRDLFVWGLS